MGSDTCCTSRQPPSPDGEPSRPVPPADTMVGTPTKAPSKAVCKPTMVSSSTTSRLSTVEDIAAMKAIFGGTPINTQKQDLSSSGLTKKTSFGALGAVKSRFQKDRSRASTPINDDMSIKSDTDSHKALATKKSLNPITVVKSKLRKQFSRDSALGKRCSTVDSSEESVSRRAEVRRINMKRIHDELSMEVFDDDAKSIGTFTNFNIIRSEADLASVLGLGEDMFLTFDRQHHALLEARGYMAVTRESSVTIKPTRRLSDPEFETGSTLRLSDTIRSRSHSLPSLSDVDRSSMELLQSFRPTRKRSSIPPLPPAPQLVPQRLPSIADSSVALPSWRLSFASEDRGRNLRKLSQGHALPIIATDDPRAVSPPPMSKWLKSQGLRVKSEVIGSSEASANSDPLASKVTVRTSTQEFGGVDGPTEGSGSIHLHEMGISNLLSRDINSPPSSLQLSTQGGRTHQRDFSSLSGASQNIHNDRPLCMRNASIETSAPSWSNVFDSWSGSQGKLTFESTKDVPTNDRQTKDALSKDDSAQHYPISTVSKFTDEFFVAVNRIDRSDHSAWFKAHKLPKPADPYGFIPEEGKSKFKEEFEKVPTGMSALLQSFHLPNFAKLGKLNSKNYDGAASTHKLGQVQVDIDISSVPTPRIGHGYHFPNSSSILNVSQGKLSVNDKMPQTAGGSIDHMNEFSDSAQHAWSRAIKMHGDATARQLGNSVKASKERRKVSNTLSLKAKSFQLSTRKSTIAKSPTSKEDSADIYKENESDDSEKFETAEEARDRIKEESRLRETEEANMRAWEHQLEEIERGAKTKSKSIVSRGRSLQRGPTTGKYPESWCRFPSHTRSERTQSAGPSDRVEAQDFASNSECKEHHEHHENKAHKTGWSSKVRAGLYQIRTASAASMSDRMHGRKSSIQVGGNVEYPELELLARDTTRDAELEREAKEMVRGAEREKRRARVVPGGDSAKDEIEADVGDSSFYSDCVPDFKDVCNGVPGSWKD